MRSRTNEREPRFASSCGQSKISCGGIEKIPGRFGDDLKAEMKPHCRIAAARINCNFVGRARKDVA
jgi:hypothetical protein